MNRLEVDHTNPRAHALYVRFGFAGHTRALLSKRVSALRV